MSFTEIDPVDKPCSMVYLRTKTLPPCGARVSLHIPFTSNVVPMNLKLIFPLFLLLATTEAVPQDRYYRGNTHTHSYPQSPDADTAWTGAKAAAFYREHGYDFIAFTDHGAWWNANPLSSAGFLVISGEEAGISRNGRWGHFTALPMAGRVSGSGLTHQELINLVVATGGIPFLNHPRYDAIPITALLVIDSMKQNLTHMEIWNGVTASQAGPDDISVWDSVLSTGRKIYGVASDDAHREGHALKGWIMVRARSLNQDSIAWAIRSGDFYPSTGIVFDSISYSAAALYVKSSNATSVRFIGKGGMLLSTVQGNEARYDVAGDEGYVRAEAANAANQRAWTQPLMLIPSTGVGSARDINEAKNAGGLEISQPFPNPANPATTVRYRLSAPAHVRLIVYDLLGRETSIVSEEDGTPGTHDVRIDVGGLPTGVYICEVRAGALLARRKLLVVK